MIRGLSRIVPNVVVGVWLAMGFLIVQPVSAEEKAKATAPPDQPCKASSVSAPMVKGALPSDDPNAAVWSSATLATFPMSPQVHWPTRILEATVKDMIVRALHDGTNVAILLEYADPTEDPDDAAAIEFMVGDKKAHFAHGQPMAQVEGGPVNIWYWKNKDNKGVDMNAKGFGTLKIQTHQDVKAKGVYANGTWKVVFTRPLATEHPDEDTQITTAGFINIAFAVWDGKKDAQRRAEGEGVPKGGLLLVVFPRRGATGLFRLLLCGHRRGPGSRISVRSDPQAKERAFSMKAARRYVLGMVGGTGRHLGHGCREVVPTSSEQKGHELYGHYCSHCHGESGRQNEGFNWSSMPDPKPKDLTNKSEMSTLKDEDIFNTISRDMKDTSAGRGRDRRRRFCRAHHADLQVHPVGRRNLGHCRVCSRPPRHEDGV